MDEVDAAEGKCEGRVIFWEDGAELVTFDKLLEVSDFVLVTCVYTPKQHYMFDR